MPQESFTKLQQTRSRKQTPAHENDIAEVLRKGSVARAERDRRLAEEWFVLDL